MELTKSFRTFAPIEASNLWSDYLQGLKNALERHGVAKAVLSTITKEASSDTHAILLFDPAGKALGGIRLEVKSKNNRLPLEKIENAYSEIIAQKINMQTQQDNKLAEICGIWVSKEAKGHKLCADLALQATNLGIKLNIATLVLLLPAHTLDYFLKLGYVIDADLPKFVYPDDRYLSTVVWYQVPGLDKKISSIHDMQMS